MKIVELTEQEIAANRELLNMAVKAGGLPVAAAALVLDKKLREAKPKPAIEQPPEDRREYHSE